MRRVKGILWLFGCIGLSLAAGDVVANPGVTGDSHMHAAQEPAQPYNRAVDQVIRAIRKQVPDAKFDITVTDLDNAVLLQGEVDSEQSRRSIVEVTHAASSKQVRDELRIRPAPADSQITEQVKDALRRDYPQLADRVQVEVRNGVAYLSGDLRNHREVDELLSTALMVEGVTDIKSDITLAGKPYVTQRMRAKR